MDTYFIVRVVKDGTANYILEKPSKVPEALFLSILRAKIVEESKGQATKEEELKGIEMAVRALAGYKGLSIGDIQFSVKPAVKDKSEHVKVVATEERRDFNTLDN